MKLKLIFEPPSGAPYGTRPEAYFLKLSNREYDELKRYANSEGVSPEEAFRCLLKEGIRIAEAEYKAR